MVRLETAIQIDASPEEVFAVLADFEAYASWNPLIVEAHGAATLGARVAMKVRPPGGVGPRLGFTATLVDVVPGRVLAWTGGLPFVASGLHAFRLTPANGGTHVSHGEEFSGALVRVVGDRLLALEPAYRAMNRALAARVTSRRG